jgi:hypothetical protein
MNFSRLAQSAVLVAALAIGTQAHAAPLVYGTYYDETTSFSCQNTSTTQCPALFSQLPADKLVMVRKIECFIYSAHVLSNGFLFISPTSGGVPIGRSLPMAILMTGNSAHADGSYRYTVDMDIHWLVGQSRFPYVNFTSDAPATIIGDCTLVGDLVTPIQ